MSSDKRTLYITSGAMLLLLIVALFLPESVNRQILAVLLVPCAAVITILNPKRSSHSVHKREVTAVLPILAVIYLLLYYLSGLYFGFSGNVYTLSFSTIYKLIAPIAMAVVCMEIIRTVLIAQKETIASIMAYVACVAADVLLSAKLGNVNNFDVFMSLMGITLFPSLVLHLVLHYTASRYGAVPNIVYRLLTSLVVYMVPLVPNVPQYLMSFFGIIFPIIVFLFMRAMYERRTRAASYKQQRAAKIASIIGIALAAAWVMLISCQFRYGIIVIATDSMTGELDVGDAVVFEEYRGEHINEGQVILFDNGHDLRIVHRVVRIEVINGETRYYTKGDANEAEDVGYITSSNIIGTAEFKIKYIGFPTLWLRAAFNK